MLQAFSDITKPYISRSHHY